MPDSETQSLQVGEASSDIGPVGPGRIYIFESKNQQKCWVLSSFTEVLIHIISPGSKYPRKVAKFLGSPKFKRTKTNGLIFGMWSGVLAF